MLMLTVCTGVYLSFKTKYLVIKDKEVYDREIGQPAVVQSTYVFI